MFSPKYFLAGVPQRKRAQQHLAFGRVPAKAPTTKQLARRIRTGLSSVFALTPLPTPARARLLTFAPPITPAHALVVVRSGNLLHGVPAPAISLPVTQRDRTFRGVFQCPLPP